MSDPVSAFAPILRTLLLAAHATERTAQGSSRRDAFRATRHLLGGCKAAGVPPKPSQTPARCAANRSPHGGA